MISYPRYVTTDNPWLDVCKGVFRTVGLFFSDLTIRREADNLILYRNSRDLTAAFLRHHRTGSVYEFSSRIIDFEGRCCDRRCRFLRYHGRGSSSECTRSSNRGAYRTAEAIWPRSRLRNSRFFSSSECSLRENGRFPGRCRTFLEMAPETPSQMSHCWSRERWSRKFCSKTSVR